MLERLTRPVTIRRFEHHLNHMEHGALVYLAARLILDLSQVASGVVVLAVAALVELIQHLGEGTDRRRLRDRVLDVVDWLAILVVVLVTVDLLVFALVLVLYVIQYAVFTLVLDWRKP